MKFEEVPFSEFIADTINIKRNFYKFMQNLESIEDKKKFLELCRAEKINSIEFPSWLAYLGIKEATQQELADYLGVKKQSVFQYDKRKKELMVAGLALIKQKEKEIKN